MQNNGFRPPSDRLLAFAVRSMRFLYRRRKAVAAVSASGIVVVAAAFLWWFLSGPKYTVAECLTGIQIHYPDDMQEKQREATVENIMDFGGKYIFRDGGPAFSAAVDDNDRGRWYFLYRDECENKHAMVQDFIDAYIMADSAAEIEIAVIREPVRPTRYNAAYGDIWIDGREERPVE